MIAKLILASALTLSANQALAHRCGNDLVQEGDHKAEVLKICGTPAIRENIGQIDQIQYESRVTVMYIDEWIYEEKDKFVRMVFEGSVLTHIENLR